MPKTKTRDVDINERLKAVAGRLEDVQAAIDRADTDAQNAYVESLLKADGDSDTDVRVERATDAASALRRQWRNGMSIGSWSHIRLISST